MVERRKEKKNKKKRRRRKKEGVFVHLINQLPACPERDYLKPLFYLGRGVPGLVVRLVSPFRGFIYILPLVHLPCTFSQDLGGLERLRLQFYLSGFHEVFGLLYILVPVTIFHMLCMLILAIFSLFRRLLLSFGRGTRLPSAFYCFLGLTSLFSS